MMNRGPGKKMLQSSSKFEVLAKMVKKACHPVSPSLEKSLARNRENLDIVYQEFYHDFKLYKADVNAPDLNLKDGQCEDIHEYNDSWFEKITDEYYELIESSDQKLEKMTPKDTQAPHITPQVQHEAKVVSEVKLRTLLEDQLKSEKKAIADSVSNAGNTLTSMQTVGFGQSQAIRGTLQNISVRIDDKLQQLFEQLLPLMDDSESNDAQREFFEFISTQRARIDSIEMGVIAKVKDVASIAPRDMGQSASNRTYLKKIEPPNFSGDILDFPEFKRKWAANVTREKLEEKSELDRLRDNVPETARKMLIGEKSLGNAWKILTKLYGNKTMLANKLKAKLKNIKVSGKEDHDVVINLAIEVKSIVKNLTEINMEEISMMMNTCLPYSRHFQTKREPSGLILTRIASPVNGKPWKPSWRMLMTRLLVRKFCSPIMLLRSHLL